MEERVPSRVFISYSHSDLAWLQKLETHLMPRIRSGTISAWADTQIGDGALWKKSIDEAVATTKLAVLLVSPEFLASDFIYHYELPQLLQLSEQKRLTILWVAVSSSAYAVTELERYQALNDPAQPLDSLSNADLNKELVRISKRIAALASDIQKAAPQVSAFYKSSTDHALVDVQVQSNQRDRQPPTAASRIRWQYLTIIAIAIIAAVLFLWTPWARGKSVEVSSPRPDSGISDLSQVVYGDSSNVSTAEEIWPVLFSRKDGHYYIHNNHTKMASDGRWCSAHVLLPADEAPGSDDFELVVLLVNSTAAKVFSDELRIHPAPTKVQRLPAGAIPGDRVGLRIVRPLVGDTGGAPGCEAILQRGRDPTWLPKVSQALLVIGLVIITIGFVSRLSWRSRGTRLGRLGLQDSRATLSLIFGGLALFIVGVLFTMAASWILDKSRGHEALFRGSDRNKDLLHIDRGAEVAPEINVDLSSARLRPGYNRWVVVRSTVENIYFPQQCVVGVPGPSNLTCGLEIGGASDFGAVFEVLLVEANEDANQFLDRYMAQPERQGLVELPAGAKVIYSLQVVRKGRKEAQQ